MTRDQRLQRLDRHGDELGVLFTAYLGQDWLDDFGEPWTNALDAFVARVGPKRLHAALAELDQLLEDLDDGDLRWLLDGGVHVAFNWEHPEFGSARVWLDALRDELKRRTPQEV